MGKLYNLLPIDEVRCINCECPLREECKRWLQNDIDICNDQVEQVICEWISCDDDELTCESILVIKKKKDGGN